MKKYLIVCLFIGLVAWLPPQEAYRFRFTIAKDCTVSAGIFTANGALIRTLFSQTFYKAGTFNYAWDGLDDLGNPVSNASSCTWKIVINNIAYTWEGVIGNTSDSMTGYSVHKSGSPPVAMCVAGKYGYYGTSYNEQNTNTQKIALDDVEKRIAIDFGAYGGTPSITDVCTDGKYVYWAAYDPNATKFSFAYATSIANDGLVSFSSGISYTKKYGHAYSVFGLDSSNIFTKSISVQKNGNYIFLVRTNRLDVFNKTNGGLIKTNTINDISFIRVDNTDSYIWIGYSTTLKKFAIKNDASLAETGISITGIGNVGAFGISTDNNKIYVCDNSVSSQQVKIYNQKTGSYISTFGSAGGYSTNAKVANNKLCWFDANAGYKPFITLLPDGSFWISDAGNARIQHFSAANQFIERIMYLPFNYNVSVDFKNPSRVFANALEFRIDYSKKLAPNNNSWALVNNWKAIMTSQEYNQYQGIKTPLTYPNGKTFCFIFASSSTLQLTELKNDGTLRRTEQMFGNDACLDKSGSLYFLSRYKVGSPEIWSKMSFTKYDSSGTPLFGSPTVVQTSPVLTNSEPGFMGDINHYRPNAITSNGTYILFDHTKSETKYHIAGVKNGALIFKTGLATSRAYRDKFPAGNLFDVGNGVQNPGGNIDVLDSTFFENYTGEFWKQSQTNKYNHYHQNGLLLNQFGVAIGAAPFYRQIVIAQDAGNAFCFYVVKLNDGRVYLYHN